MLLRAVLSLAGFVLFLAVVTLLPAGIGWRNGWLFLAVLLILMMLSVGYLWRVNPGIFVARSQIHEGTKPWDKVIVALLLASLAAIFPVAGLDARFHWSSMPLWLVVLGYGLFVLGFIGSIWVYCVNKFAEPGVRIQPEQEVVDTGPYAIVRHPLYLASFFLVAGIPLALGSFWALIPVGTGSLVLVVRTALEDRTLQDELGGYREYAGRVRYRLIPGVW
jgi:protein-S-isoprenylcysteine O-methyltransferase Ste14